MSSCFRLLPCLLVFGLACVPATAEPSASVPLTSQPEDGELARLVESHVRFLSDDLLEGRATGQRGHAIAALYVAAQFKRIGLEPAGDEGTFYQTFTLEEAKNDLEKGALSYASASGEGPLALQPLSDVLVSTAPGATRDSLSAPSVFIGYGVSAVEFGHDDLAGVDLQGKIAVVLSGAPPWLPAEPRAHFTATKQEVLSRTGAVGIVTLTTPRDESRRPWAFTINSARFPSMKIVERDGRIHNGFPELRLRAAVNVAAARKFMTAAGQNFEDLFRRAEAKEKVTFSLPGSVTLAAEGTAVRVTSLNVLARLPGRDPAQASRPAVITGHLDHIGIGPAINGDNLYNGTLDNAMGSGTILALAEKLALTGFRGQRPVIFALVTAEEKGLLGSNWLSRNLPPGVEAFAGNINIDMPVLSYPLREVVGWGSEHSSLGNTLAASAARQGFVVRPDPSPDETIFVRSDQYSFVKTGVPAMYIGPLPDTSPGSFRKERYHKPSDDLSQPIDWPSVGAYTRFLQDVVRSVAESPEAPAWIPGDFFQRTFAPASKAP